MCRKVVRRMRETYDPKDTVVDYSKLTKKQGAVKCSNSKLGFVMTREEAVMCLLDCFYKDGNGLIYVDSAMEEQFFEARHMAIEALRAQQEQCGLTNEQLGRLVSNSYAEGYEDCKAGKPQLEKRTEYQFGEWISVKDGLPEVPEGYERIQVIVRYCYGVDTAWFQRDTKKFYDIAGWLRSEVIGVTHWMLMPDPPKEEKK